MRRNELKREMSDGMESRCNGSRVVGTTMKKPIILYVSVENRPRTACNESPRSTIHAIDSANSSKQNLQDRSISTRARLSQSKLGRERTTYSVSTNNLAFHPKALIPKSLYP